MCTPRRMRPTSRSETTSCRAAARWRASSASCCGRKRAGERAPLLPVLVPGHRGQLVARAPGGLERVTRLAPLRSQQAPREAEPPLLLLVLELALPALGQPVSHELGKVVGHFDEGLVVGPGDLQHAQERRPRSRDRVVRGRRAHDTPARHPGSHRGEPDIRARAQHAGHHARAGEQALERAPVGDDVGEGHHAARRAARERARRPRRDPGSAPRKPAASPERRTASIAPRSASSHSGRVIT